MTDAREPERTVPAEFLRDESPIIETSEVAHCPVCGNDRHSSYAAGYDYELRTCANLWRFVCCSMCGHVWLNPRPAVGTLSTIYPPHYYAYRYTETVASVALKIKNGLDARKFSWIHSRLGRRATSFADIGCGDGRYLGFAHRAGVAKDRVYGLELDQKTVDRLCGLGFRAYNQRVEDCQQIGDGTLDLATMFHVIEHVDVPKTVVRRIASWLAPGGVVAMETPNLEGLDAKLFKRTYWGGYHIPRHWNLFTQSTLARLFTDAGLEVVATRAQTGHSFWMYSLHHVVRYSGGGSRPRPSAFFDPVGGVKALPGLAAFTAFDLLRGSLGMPTSSMLMLARKR